MSEPAKPRVLIIDDRTTNIHVTARALAPEFSAEFALSGEQALEKLTRDELPELILLDVLMPEMDGYEVCRRLKSAPRTREIPVIFITAGDELETELGAVLAMLAGAADFIPKPVNPQVLRQRIRTHVMLRERTREVARLRGELRYSACHEPITGLPNRALLTDRLLQRARRGEQPLANRVLLLVKLDEPTVAATREPDTGDALLRQIADRLARAARPFETLAWLAEGELLVVLEPLQQDPQTMVMAVAERIQAELARSYRLSDVSFQGQVRVGIHRLVSEPTDIEELLDLISHAMREPWPGDEKQPRWLDQPSRDTHRVTDPTTHTDTRGIESP